MKRVLIVDDNADICDAIAMNLEDRYKVSIALNGAAALPIILAGGVDAGLLDLWLDRARFG